MHPDVNSPAGSEASVVFTKGGGTGDLQLPDAGLLFFRKCWVFSGRPGGGEETTRIMSPGHQLKLTRARVLRQLCGLHLIISVHLTASCSSISLSLYWLRSISTRAISTRVKRFLWAVGTSLCGSTQRRLVSHRRTLGRGRTHAPSCKILTSSSSLFLFFMSSTSSRTLEEILYQLSVLLQVAQCCRLTFSVPPPALCSCPPAWSWPAGLPPAPPQTSPSRRSVRPPSRSNLCSLRSGRSCGDRNEGRMWQVDALTVKAEIKHILCLKQL